VPSNLNTLTHWKWRLSAEPRAAKERRNPDGAGGFVEVVSPILGGQPGAAKPKARPVEALEPLTLVLRNGLLLRIPARFNEASLRQVLSAVEGR
jgi:hypothetical protein